MRDEEVLGGIEQLAQEEHRLLEAEGHGQLDNDGRERLRSIEVRLDQCWDLLRQRRARRAAGADPNDASIRSADVVEHYNQ